MLRVILVTALLAFILAACGFLTGGNDTEWSSVDECVKEVNKYIGALAPVVKACEDEVESYQRVRGHIS